MESMYKEKILDGIYGIELIAHMPEKLYELKRGASIHLITHHINDEAVIHNIVRVLLDMECKVFHVFGEYHDLWINEIVAQGDSSVIAIDYFIELQEFKMDLVTHLIERSELIQHNQDIESGKRLDYLLYDDIGFFWMVQDSVKEYRELEHDK